MSFNPHPKYMIALLILTGVRQSHLFEARWEHFDLHSIWNIASAKGLKDRRVDLPDEVVRVIQDLPSSERARSADRREGVVDQPAHVNAGFEPGRKQRGPLPQRGVRQA